MRKFLAAVTMAVAATVGLAAPASAATGHQRFVITFRDDRPGRVVATGVVSATGRDFEDPNGNFGTFVFPDGTFEVVHPQTSDHFSFDPETCTGTDRFAGTYTLRRGTGDYKGIRGSGTYNGTATSVGRHTAHGCSNRPVSTVVVVHARGTTTLP